MTRTPNRRRTWLALTGVLATLASLLLVGAQASPAQAAEGGPIRIAGTNLCLTVPNGQRDEVNGHQLTYETCSVPYRIEFYNLILEARQRWVKLEGGFIWNPNTKLCLDTSWGLIKSNQPVTVGECQWNEDRQKWWTRWQGYDGGSSSQGGFLLHPHGWQFSVGAPGDDNLVAGQPAILEYWATGHDRDQLYAGDPVG